MHLLFVSMRFPRFHKQLEEKRLRRLCCVGVFTFCLSTFCTAAGLAELLNDWYKCLGRIFHDFPKGDAAKSLGVWEASTANCTRREVFFMTKANVGRRDFTMLPRIFWEWFGADLTIYIIILFQLAQLLPMEENFLLLFRFDNPLESSVEFMKVKYALRVRTHRIEHAWKYCLAGGGEHLKIFERTIYNSRSALLSQTFQKYSFASVPNSN